MFVKMGNDYVRMSSIESARVNDDFLVVTTNSDHNYYRKIEEGQDGQDIINQLIHKLAELEAESNGRS